MVAWMDPAVSLSGGPSREDRTEVEREDRGGGDILKYFTILSTGIYCSYTGLWLLHEP